MSWSTLKPATYPDWAEPTLRLGESLRRAGDARAEAAYAQALERDATRAETLIGLGTLLFADLRSRPVWAALTLTFGYAFIGFLDDWLKLVLKCGEMNLRAMELLDAGNTGTYGHPVPTKVPLGEKKGKAILVSGHDLKDLEEILKQTAGKGISLYTHGEMLPAHGYPGLKKYKHLAGNYGGAWQDQKVEFARSPGAILITTNCIQEPQ